MINGSFSIKNAFFLKISAPIVNLNFNREEEYVSSIPQNYKH